jgi:fucose 4-O-acetylase-like acetyltransferase
MEPNVTNQRLISLDVLKGLIMTIIVFGHMIVNERATEAGGEASMPVIVQALYLGLMAYFILSGYFYRPGRGFKINMMKRVKQILVALVVAGVTIPLIMYVYLNILGYGLPFDDYLNAVILSLNLFNAFVPWDSVVDPTCLSAASAGTYFLFTMLWGFLIFYALADRVIEDDKKVLAVIIVLLIIECLLKLFLPVKLPFAIYLGPIAAAFMFLGAWLARRKILENIENGSKREVKYWAIPLICLAIGIGLCCILPPNILFDSFIFGDYSGYSVFPFFAEAAFMFIPIAYLGYLFSLIPGISWAVSKVGQHTIGVILIHPLIAKMIIAVSYPVSATVLAPDVVPMDYRLFAAFMALAIPTLLCCLWPMVKERMMKKKTATTEES